MTKRYPYKLNGIRWLSPETLLNFIQLRDVTIIVLKERDVFSVSFSIPDTNRYGVHLWLSIQVDFIFRVRSDTLSILKMLISDGHVNEKYRVMYLLVIEPYPTSICNEVVNLTPGPYD